jgi:protein-S-isoprenylcysteine O-methyltransferase Ste14
MVGYIRYPMHPSLFSLAWGAVLKSVVVVTVLLGVVASSPPVGTAKHEEGERVTRFGQPCLDYTRRTPRFVPVLI